MPSLTATLIGLALVAHSSAHLSLINIYGSNNIVGHAFGVNLYGKYPRVKGQPGDAGGDSGIFEIGTDNPSPACGSTPELGPVDVIAWMSQAEGDGLPAAYANMSVVVEAFQVNRDGGGPMSCEYNEDATTTSWKPMFMTLNQAGNSGIQNSLRTNETVVMNFPSDAKCTGGWTQTACIVRCRTGVNKRFGGCFAVKLSDSTTAAVTTDAETKLRSLATNDSLADGASDVQTTDAQVQSIVEQVILQMKKDGLMISASSAAPASPAVSGPMNVTTLSRISQGIQLEPNSTSTVQAPLPVDQNADNTTSIVSSNATVDASDAADSRLYNISKTTGSAVVAAHIVDDQAFNLSSSGPAATIKPHRSQKQHRRCHNSHKKKSKIIGSINGQ